MGQNQGGPFQEGSELMSEYRITKREPQLMQTYLSHRKTDQECLLKEFTISELREFSITTEKIKNRKNLSSNFLTLLKDFQEKTEDSMCSDFYKIYTLWEYPHKSLAEDLANRKIYKTHFSQKQLKQILQATVQGMKTMQERQMKHECLTIFALRMDKKSQLKVADPLACGDLPNFDTVFNNRKIKDIYLSPQQCWSIKNEKPIQNKNCYKNDVFTFGMILLECGLLESQSQCYEDGYIDIKWNEVNASLSNLTKNYGDGILKKVIQNMVDPQIGTRPDWLTLSRIIGGGYKQFKVQKKSQQDQVPRKTETIMPSQLPTIKSVESEGTYSQSFSSRQSYPIEHIINRVQQNPIAIPKQVQGPTLRISSPYKASVVPFSPPQPRQEGKRTTINSPEKRQITFNFVSSPFRSTVVPPPPPPVVKAIQRPPIQPIPPNVYPQMSQNIRNTTPPKISLGPIFSKNSSPSQNQEPIPITIRQSSLQGATFQLHPTQPNRQSPQIFQNQRFSFQREVETKTEKRQEPPEAKEGDQIQFVEQFFKMGSRYEGYKLNGMRHGKGKFYYQDGGFYDGEWKQNQMNGIGTLYYQSNTKAYEGQWVNDEFHGRGSLYNQTPQMLNECFDYRNFDEIGEYWVFYQGDFIKDAKEGEGKLKFSNGEEFKGHFKEDMVQGEGFFTTKNNVTIHGLWNQNQLVKLYN